MHDVRGATPAPVQYLQFRKPILIPVIEQIRFWMRKQPPQASLNATE